jgi:hypothetical protein
MTGGRVRRSDPKELPPPARAASTNHAVGTGRPTDSGTARAEAERLLEVITGAAG